MKKDKKKITIEKQDLVNKIETLNGYIEYFSKKYEPFDNLYPVLVEEVKGWVEEIRANKIKFINN